MIYLDNAATTQIDKEVLKAMLEELQGPPSNPSSSHFLGRRAKLLLINAREEIASFLKVSPKNLLFTSGGTESINLAIKGYLSNIAGGHIISRDIEHAAVYNTLQTLPKNYEVTFIKGTDLKAAIRKDTILIVLSAANSETGVKIDLESIAKEAGDIPLIIDGVALLGKELFRIPDGVSAMCFSSHKIHGPKGVGLLYFRNEFKFAPLLQGGYQENRKRAGTENLAGIVGFAKAVSLISQESIEYMRNLRDNFEKEIQKALPSVLINGEGDRVSNISNLAFMGIDGETLFLSLDQRKIATSLGSACSSSALEPSRVLLNMGLPRDRVKSSIRFSLSRFTTKEELDATISFIINLIDK